MHPLEVGALGERRAAPVEVGERLGVQCGEDGAQPVDALGMAGRGAVAEAGRMSEQGDGNGRLRTIDAGA
jgi:hypothetical protein